MKFYITCICIPVLLNVCSELYSRDIDTKISVLLKDSLEYSPAQVGVTSDIYDSIPLQTQNCEDSGKLVLIFAGDIMGHDAQIEGAYNGVEKIYDYEPTFRHIRDYISDADVAIGNLEVTLAGTPFKGYPQFSSPDELAFAARDAGFDILVTANNHALDRGGKGVKRTLDMLDSLSFLRAGTYYDSLDRDTLYPLIFEKNSIRIALLNYTYGTNGLTVELPYSVNRIDTALIHMDLKKAELAEPDFIMVYIHWGIEYERTENKTQVALARFMFEKGADAVIGSHPHVIQPIRKVYLNGDTTNHYPVVYSLGNFVSNQRAQYKDGGIIAELLLTKEQGIVKLETLKYLPYWVWRDDSMPGKSTFYVLPVAKYEAGMEQYPLSPSDQIRIQRFANDTREHLKIAVESDYYKKKEVTRMSNPGE